MNLLKIIWDVNPSVFPESWGIPLDIRWYGVIYAIGFFLAIKIIDQTFKHDNAPKGWTDKVFFYLILATIVGSRLGHCFFYDWDYYSQNIMEIFMVWRGGLASHGGAIALLVGVWLLSRYMTKQNMFWLADRVFMGSALVASLIRIGNLMNSEIYGSPTDLPWGFVFARGSEHIGQACHPTQIYESLAYLLVFGILMFVYWKKEGGKYNGLLSGIGFLGIFIARQFIEIIKNNQSAFEDNMTFNMGQWLSVPFVILGITLIVRALKMGKVEYQLPKEKE